MSQSTILASGGSWSGCHSWSKSLTLIRSQISGKGLSLCYLLCLQTMSIPWLVYASTARILSVEEFEYNTRFFLRQQNSIKLHRNQNDVGWNLFISKSCISVFETTDFFLCERISISDSFYVISTSWNILRSSLYFWYHIRMFSSTFVQHWQIRSLE